ncbi:hypothetical protein DPMN_159481 [Dreissena polymorpha]|uniref:Uncharacterized protein n=1 Tax=Dreissena polymorpha TaxID=45954 RepID=A0A9D4IQR4_DREPO|nr:hypothetical protein DPMN_159481 [Dreissena polymorpha]
MWIITHGFNNGVAKLIGEAVKEYNIKQQNSRIVSNQYLSLAERMKRRLPVIGIVPKDKVLSGAHLDEMVRRFCWCYGLYSADFIDIS